ncbi:TlpA family protein disulfide reductase [Pollutibacter soli]|uniref:TlpA family protein disulfide reductase n=1 Tax=Pollutibacter soli TaxID=3034157 RepID=UPI00301419E4
MTTTILFWIKIIISAVIVWTFAKYIRSWVKNTKKGLKPVLKKSDVISDIIFVTFAGFILYFIQTNYQRTFNSVLATPLKAFPDFSFTEISTDSSKNLNNYHSELTLINYWATWCGPCRREMPSLNEIYSEFERNELEIIAISDEDKSVIKNYVNNKNFHFITAKINRSNSLLDSIGQRPVSILLDREHKVLDMIVGSRGHRFFKNWVRENLDKTRATGSE